MKMHTLVFYTRSNISYQFQELLYIRTNRIGSAIDNVIVPSAVDRGIELR